MTAHTQIKADPIAAFMPWVAEPERSLHRRLLNVKVGAACRAKHCANDRARSLWWLASDIAGENALEPTSRAHLEDVLRTVTRLEQCADALEHWEPRHG
jgi:hypothetical protein